MSRVTKQIAESVAIELTKKNALEIKELKADLDNKFTEIYLKTVPKEVLQLFEKYPDYVETRSSMQMSGNGFQYQSLSLNKSFPAKNHVFLPNEKDAKMLLLLVNEISDKKSEHSKLKQEVSALLFNLKTYNRVNSEFPEATPFLPKTVTSALMVNISDLREKLK